MMVGRQLQVTGIEALKALPLDAILTVNTTEPWLADSLPETAAGDGPSVQVNQPASRAR